MFDNSYEDSNNDNQQAKLSRPCRCRYCSEPIVFNFKILSRSGNPRALDLDGRTIHKCRFSSKFEEEYVMSAYEFIDEVNRRIESYRLTLEKLEKSVVGATK